MLKNKFHKIKELMYTYPTLVIPQAKHFHVYRDNLLLPGG
jgi:hypothetical protein